MTVLCSWEPISKRETTTESSRVTCNRNFIEGSEELIVQDIEHIVAIIVRISSNLGCLYTENGRQSLPLGRTRLTRLYCGQRQRRASFHLVLRSKERIPA